MLFVCVGFHYVVGRMGLSVVKLTGLKLKRM